MNCKKINFYKTNHSFKHIIGKFKRYWYKYSQNSLSVVGLIAVLLVVIIAVFAPYIAPYPESVGTYVNFEKVSQPPSKHYIFGTDRFGRDVFSRVLFGFRLSLLMGIVVISISVPIGVLVGLVAGYFNDRWFSPILMRFVDIFVSVPILIMALVVCSVLTPDVFNAMIAVSIAWWAWYARIIYSLVCSLKGEFYIRSAEIIGASTAHILFKEILPNCMATIFTKMSLDMAVVIIIGASLSFVGLGAQPPTPDLGTMVADGANFLPEQWWLTLFPAAGIVFIVLGFNLLGDGIRDMLGAEEG